VQELRTRRAHITSAEPPTLGLALRSLEFAGQLGDDELAQLAARSEYRHHDAGRVLLAEGAVSDAFYVIAGGLVDSNVLLPDGSRRRLETLGPGSYFGLTAMLTTEPSFEEFIAKSDVTLIRVDLEALRPFVETRPELKEKLVQLVKARWDLAEAAQAQSRRRSRRLTLRDIRIGIERRLHQPRDSR
jgi:CRP-like cAMP-binding protein